MAPRLGKSITRNAKRNVRRGAKASGSSLGEKIVSGVSGAVDIGADTLKTSAHTAAGAYSTAAEAVQTGAKTASNVAGRAHQFATSKELGSIGRNISRQRNQIMGKTLKNAAGGAAIGGVVNLAQGEDFWEGAGQGALVGGAVGAVRHGTRAGLGGHRAFKRSDVTGKTPGMGELWGRSPIGKSYNTMVKNAELAKKAVVKNTPGSR